MKRLQHDSEAAPGASKKAGGAKRGFKAKLLQGHGIGDMADAALFGDVALTPGGKLARRYLELLDACVISDTKHNRLSLDMVREQFSSALAAGNADLFRQIAAFIDAQKRVKKSGPTDPAHFFAADYIQICELYPRDRRQPMPQHFANFPSVVAAWKREPFRPTVKQILGHLEERMGDSAPDYKTVERIAERLGTKAPAPRSQVKDAYRQFWEW